MESPAILTTGTTDLDRLQRREARAHECIDKAMQSWIDFVDELNAIQTEGDWKAKADTWQAYLATEFLPKLSIGYDRIYQLKAAQPFAKAVESGTGIVLNERQTRLVKSLGYKDPQAPLTAELVIRASAAARVTGQALKPRHIKAAAKVLDERAVTDGHISLEGESIPTNKILDITQLAIVQDAMEATERGLEHMRNRSKRVKRTGILEVIKDAAGRERLALPASISAAAGQEVIWYENLAESEAA